MTIAPAASSKRKWLPVATITSSTKSWYATPATRTTGRQVVLVGAAALLKDEQPDRLAVGRALAEAQRAQMTPAREA